MAVHGPVSVGNISGGSVTTLTSGNPSSGEYPIKIRIDSSAYWRNNSTVNVKFRLRVCDIDNPSVYVQWGETDTVAPGYSYNKQYLNNEYPIGYDSRLLGKKIGFTFLTDFNDATFLWGGGSITLTTNKKTYTVTWNFNGGTGSPATSQVEHNGIPSHTNPTKATDTEYVYSFASWQKNNNDVVLANERITADTTYTARYTSTKRSYTIAANISPAGAGTLSVPTSAVWGDTVNLAQTPAADYEFVKWQLNGTDLSGDSFTMPKEDVTVTAVYREAHKTVRYYTGGAFVECIPYYHDGEDFIEVEPRYWDGTQWVLCSHT